MYQIMMSGIFAVSLLAGCTSPPKPEDAPRPPPMKQQSPGECNVTAVWKYIGEEYRAAHEQILANESGAQRIRVVRPGESYTMDYRPERLSIHLDDEGKIRELSCG